MAKPWIPARHYALRSSRVALGICVALAVGLGGCRAVDNAQVDVLERELRQQEDYIYELEDYLIEYSEKLRTCRSCQPGMSADSTSPAATKRGGVLREPTIANDPPRSTAARRPNGARVVPPIEDPLTPADAFEAPPLEAPALPAAETAPATAPTTAPSVAPAAPVTPTPSTTAPVDPTELEAPALEIGPTSRLKWEGAAPIATASPGEQAPPYIPDPADYQLEAETSEKSVEVAAASQGESSLAAPSAPPQLIGPEAAPTTVVAEPAAPVLPPASDPERLVAQRLQIRRVLRDASEAEETHPRSLMVIVEALNATDEPVDANGEASLMVSRGATPESLRPIERWDFTADETRAAWQSSQLGDGLHLELPLAGALPDDSVFLWVRLVTAEGQKLQAKVQFAANELTTLEAAIAETSAKSADSLTSATLPEASEAVATDDAAAGHATASARSTTPAVASAAVVEGEATSSATGAQWRASNEPLNGAPVVASASTVGGAHSSGWTTQAPGRMPTPPTPRVATASGSPRWEQGSNAPASESPRAWAPFR